MSTRLAAMSALSSLLLGCGVFGSDFTVRHTVDIHSASTDPLCQSDTLTFNLADNQTFRDLKGNLYSLELKKLRVEVVNPKARDESLATQAHGQITVSAALTETGVTLGTYQDVPLEQGAAQEIVFDKSAAKTLTELALHAPNTFFIDSNGCTDAVPAFFDFEVTMTFYATVGF